MSLMAAILDFWFTFKHFDFVWCIPFPVLIQTVLSVSCGDANLVI